MGFSITGTPTKIEEKSSILASLTTDPKAVPLEAPKEKEQADAGQPSVVSE